MKSAALALSSLELKLQARDLTLAPHDTHNIITQLNSSNSADSTSLFAL